MTTHELTDGLPTSLRTALLLCDPEQTTGGMQRTVFVSDTFVVKYDFAGQSNCNEIAWFDCAPEQVAPCQPLNVDMALPEDMRQGTWLVMEKVEELGFGEDWQGGACACCHDVDENNDLYDTLSDICWDDLHDQNVGTLPSGRLVAIDMGCCHPETGDSGSFHHDERLRYKQSDKVFAALQEAI